MTSCFKVFVVDDDPLVLDVISMILAPDCELDLFENAEDCLAALESKRPDLFLLDINLPKMDGFELCKVIKSGRIIDPPSPVIFISSHDTIDERIRGYDAGAEDFIVKPFEPEELLRKLKVAQQIVLNQRSLAEQVKEAEYLSSLIMASMDETGILLQFTSKLIGMESAQEVSEGILELLHRYRLEGVVQTRLGKNTSTLSASGADIPLEVSIVEHVRDQGRIFEFRRRSVHNFERVTLMVNNLPIEDPDFCGRLRDHLSVAAQGADSRLKAIHTDELNRQSQEALRSALDSVGQTLASLRLANQRNSTDSSKLITDLQETLVNSFFKLGLTDNQEKFLQNMVGDFMARMAELLSQGLETQKTLERLSMRLEQFKNS